MAGALSGVMHAPLTAIFLIAEITGGYVLFIPLMIVSAISYIINRLFKPHNIYWHHLIEENIHPNQDYDMLNAIRLDSVINKQFTAVSKDTKATDFYKTLATSNANIFAVLAKDGSLEGVVVWDGIRKQLFEEGADTKTVAELMITPPAIIYYEQPASTVMEVFDALDVWQLPVIKNDRFIGFISKSALLSKYREVFIKQHRESDIFSA
jgi:CIC family chloride channel protein